VTKYRYLDADIFPFLSFGHLRNISATISIGAVKSPTAVSKGGLVGTRGCERDGINIFV
jgi:hypothetical protein